MLDSPSDNQQPTLKVDQRTTLGPYQLLSVIGEGGMGTVYKALQPSLNRYVAIKVLPEYLARDKEFVQRFRHEATTAASLQHPNILTIYDVGQEGNQHYIVMQLLEGCTLAQLIEREHALSLPRTAHIISQMAAALDCAHQRQIIHRDVKPSNIFVGAGDHVTLMDFGIVKALSGTRLTRTGATVGTPEYMSPEQAESRTVDHRSDLYSLGIVLYQMLTGRVPFAADTPAAIMYAHVHMPPTPPSQLNPAVASPIEAVVLKALMKDPEARYQSGEQMVAALNAAIRQSESLMLENLYTRAAKLMAEWKMDEAVAVWEQLRQIRPDYKDAAAQLILAQHQRDTWREYHDLAQTVKQTRQRIESFARHYPNSPDPEQIFEPRVQSSVANRLNGLLIGAGALLIVSAAVVALLGYHRQIQPSAPTLEQSPVLQLLSWGNFNIGLGIGLSIGGLVLLLWPLFMTILNRSARRR